MDIDKRAWLGFVLLSLLSLFATSGSRSAFAAGWEVTFEDAFDGDRLDRDKWATRFVYSNEQLDFLGGKNGEEQRYRDNGNHEVSNGRLRLIARLSGSPDAKYESGLIRSYRTFYYGYFEAKLKLPPGRGTWPAFWLIPDQDENGDITWPPEIDILDNANNERDDDPYRCYPGSWFSTFGRIGLEAS
jgi:beta-glucanase (GH16 family)